jgi:hypothetical protein
MDRVGFEPTTSAAVAFYLSKVAAIERELITAQIPPGPIFLCMLRNHGP